VATGTIRVLGLRELQRDFKKISKELSKDLRKELVEAAAPVKKTAESLALGKIRNMPASPRWAEMRIGVTARSVYMVPFARRRGRSGRPNLADLLMERAMDPALEQNADEVTGRIDNMLGHLFSQNGF
jgi:Bacteriophage HK97-gp10, putative tail-component